MAIFCDITAEGVLIYGLGLCAKLTYEVIGEYDFSGCFSPTDSRGYSILTVKNSADGSVILTVKYDTGRVLDKESILSTALTDGIYADSKIYTDEALREELTTLTLSSNSVIYVSLENQK